MCGIVGIITKATNGFTYNQQKMFYQLLIANEVRGADATGVIAVENTGDFSVMREASSAYYFTDQFAESVADKGLFQRGAAVIGHNRAKTVGANKDENAHPFTVDNTFSMVHNGTLRNHHELGTHEVDSQSLAVVFKEAMDKEDWKTAMEEAIGKVRGAYAVVWYDQKRHQVCMLRNTERPLGYVDTKESIVFGSELGLLGWIASRNGEAVKEWISLDTSTLYTFDLKEGKGAVQKTFLSLSTPSQPSGTSTTTMVLVSPTTPTGQRDSTIDIGVGPLTKNAFKRLRAHIFRKDLEFVVEDYVEAAGGSYLIMGAVDNGAYDIDEHRHFIRACVVLDDLGLEEADFYGGEEVRMKGVVADVEYDKQLKLAVILMENCSVVNKTVH